MDMHAEHTPGAYVRRDSCQRTPGSTSIATRLLTGVLSETAGDDREAQGGVRCAVHLQAGGHVQGRGPVARHHGLLQVVGGLLAREALYQLQETSVSIHTLPTSCCILAHSDMPQQRAMPKLHSATADHGIGMGLALRVQSHACALGSAARPALAHRSVPSHQLLSAQCWCARLCRKRWQPASRWVWT